MKKIKNDLEKKISDKDIKDLKNVIYISAKTGFGIDELKEKVKELQENLSYNNSF